MLTSFRLWFCSGFAAIACISTRCEWLSERGNKWSTAIAISFSVYFMLSSTTLLGVGIILSSILLGSFTEVNAWINTFCAWPTDSSIICSVSVLSFTCTLAVVRSLVSSLTCISPSPVHVDNIIWFLSSLGASNSFIKSVSSEAIAWINTFDAWDTLSFINEPFGGASSTVRRRTVDGRSRSGNFLSSFPFCSGFAAIACISTRCEWLSERGNKWSTAIAISFSVYFILSSTTLEGGASMPSLCKKSIFCVPASWFQRAEIRTW